ncbi:hypothetical protein AZO1586R_959 [Bathymodiolus azoricus thioautotrophic gill symbiont]|uniref:Uncharacterized protein n=2 Tax=Bathymodiolus azoricus thioautotrophic gill symbiont TaxID=235205 RepID=A0ACA8ZTU9_9GAMM|nr:integrase domain-containing protein [Bathymodiolus azoricus thioautotrophic gill symbiont]CAB5499630.1 hypothetical protein AZO1586R_959 [Bathymodiolus azoricus thioautotrophic gill symbiont]
MNSHQQLEKILQHNKDGSYSTQSARADVLHQFINDMHQAGYKDFKLLKVGGRHIDRAVSGWKDNNLSPATMANRVSHLRWLSQKINKQNIVPRTNRELGIGRRSYVAQVDQSQQLPNQATMNQFTQRQQLSMQLAREFGLRREESLKFQVNVADKGDRVDLKPSWCKGGRARSIDVKTQEQRQLLDKIKSVVGKQNQSLIPKEQTYYKAMKDLSNKCSEHGIKMHGLRHAYAQDRYKEITGRDAPVRSNEAVPRDQIDKAARLQISQELGHNRIEITNCYLGSNS